MDYAPVGVALRPMLLFNPRALVSGCLGGRRRVRPVGSEFSCLDAWMLWRDQPVCQIESLLSLTFANERQMLGHDLPVSTSSRLVGSEAEAKQRLVPPQASGELPRPSYGLLLTVDHVLCSDRCTVENPQPSASLVDLAALVT